MTERDRALDELARTIAANRPPHPLRVAIDGVDAAGKTKLAGELADRIQRLRRPAIRASIDGFHNPRAVRYRRGADSPEGYFEDSFDLAAVVRCVLDPLGPGGTRRYVASIYDWRDDAPVAPPERDAPADAVLLFDGVFLLRPELRAHWDLAIWVDAAFDVTVSRAEARARDAGESVDGLRERYRRRYVPGQILYLESCRPAEQADLVVDNNDLLRPRVRDQRRVVH